MIMLKNTPINSNIFRLSPEVSDALLHNRPVVALESSIIANGMPHPVNIETAFMCEQIIRDNAAVPATIAVMDGKICVGLTRNEIEAIGDPTVVHPKLSTKDLAPAVAKKIRGATTVSATMVCAESVGIKVFATGGIGGVHRGAELSLDISTDLETLARKNVAVVCAGVKSILDIGRTLEVLETLGVPVIGYQTEQFPAFFCRTSGFATDCSAQSPDEIAAIIKTKSELSLAGGLIIANPIGPEDAMDEAHVERVILRALRECQEKNIRGKAVTPFLLSVLTRETIGDTLRANVALVKNNALLAAQIACSLSK